MSAQLRLTGLRRMGVLGGLMFGFGVVGACASGSTAEEETPQGGTGAGGAGAGGAATGGTGGKASTGGASGAATGGASTGGKSGSSGTGGSSTGGTAGSSAGGSGGSSGSGTGGASAGGSSGSSGATAGGSGGATGGSSGSSGQGGTAGTGMCDPKNAEKCNGFDDNCNMMIDEGDPEGGMPCDVPGKEGECKKGIAHCKNGKIECVQINLAKPEVCDSLDNNCDGMIDNAPFDTATKPTPGDACDAKNMDGTLKKGICAAGTLACTAGKLVCNQTNQPGMEICNGQDDNCDGSVDEGSPGANLDCTVAGQPPNSPCSKGKTGCGMNGQISCIQVVMPKPEVCDGIDNECSGNIDPPAKVNNQDCDSGLQGVCKAGKTFCPSTPNPVGQCNAVIKAGQQMESCNGLDDDCDGMADNGNQNSMCATNFPMATFVQTWLCGTGKCSISQCTSGHADVDAAPGNGCECASDVYANACNIAGTLSVVAGSPSTMSGIIETAAGQDWVRFNFADSGIGKAYHPRIQLTNDAGGQYAMDVMADCATAAGCSTTGTANNETGAAANTWEQNYLNYVPGVPGPGGTGCCTDPTGRGVSMLVKVRRKNGDAPTCVPYTVVATLL